MKNLFFLIFLFFIFSACNIQKRAVKTKTDRDLQEQIITKTFRRGDTVTYEIPNFILKDTTIVKVNTVGSRIETVYNSRGDIDLINCITSSVEELKEENRSLREFIKDKEKEKTENFDSSSFLYVVGGIVLVFFFALFLFYKMVDKKLKSFGV